MALMSSDDEDIDFRRQRFQHPDDVDDMDLNSDSDGEPDQVGDPRYLSRACMHVPDAFYDTLHIKICTTASRAYSCREANGLLLHARAVIDSVI